MPIYMLLKTIFKVFKMNQIIRKLGYNSWITCTAARTVRHLDTTLGNACHSDCITL